MELLDRSGVGLEGKLACVVGRSNIVGIPVAMLLQNRNATVTVLHSKTPNAKEICSKADVVVAAIGKPECVTGEWIKEGAVVIDVGINSVDVSAVCWAWAGKAAFCLCAGRLFPIISSAVSMCGASWTVTPHAAVHLRCVTNSGNFC